MIEYLELIQKELIICVERFNSWKRDEVPEILGKIIRDIENVRNNNEN